MSIITIAANDSLNIVKEGGEIFVVSRDRQFRNSYANVWNSGKLFGVGYHVDGRAVDITKWLSAAEMEWLFDEVKVRAFLLK